MSGTTLSEEPCTSLPSALSCLVSKQTLLLGCHLFLPSCTAWTSTSVPCFVITCMLLDARVSTLNWSSPLKGQRWIPCFQAQSIYFSLFNLFTDCDFHHSNILEIPPPSFTSWLKPSPEIVPDLLALAVPLLTTTNKNSTRTSCPYPLSLLFIYSTPGTMTRIL